MKAGWEVKPLGKVADVIAGQSPKSSAYNVTGDGLPFYQGKKDYGQRFLKPPTKWTTQVTKEADAGDILMSVRAPVGPLNEATEKICIGRGLAAIRAGQGIDREFLWYALRFLEPEIAGREGAVFASINKAGIEALSIPLPPLEEQKRIVAVLDAAFEGLTRVRIHIETNLQNARELFESTLRATFTAGEAEWPQKFLPAVCVDFGRGKSKHRPRNDPSLYGGDIPFLQTGDLSSMSRFIEDASQRYSEKGLAQSKLWPSGTVCIAIVGATIGETGITRFDACFPDSVIGMTPDPDLADSEFIDFLLQNYKTKLKKAGEGSARDNINLGTFAEISFPVPCLETQQKAVSNLVQVLAQSDQACTLYTAKLQDLDDLRQSLLQKAFAGELT